MAWAAATLFLACALPHSARAQTPVPAQNGTAQAQSADATTNNGTAPTPLSTETLEAVVVTAQRDALLGVATTSSQGIIVQQELSQLPAFRVGQLLETVPGLVVTSHSGEGKANQYLLRGFNLDHGTDLATFVDGMPINMRTHGHGQGYTDLNFLIPELASSVQFTKGPYFASEGDFSSVGSDHIALPDEIDDQAKASVGTLGYQRLFGAGTTDTGRGRLLGAAEFVHYDGPWTHHDNDRKVNLVLRYSEGQKQEGFSLTGMYYHGLWNATTDQPERAMDPAYMNGLGLTPIGRFGSLDPSDGGKAQRWSLSGRYSHGTLDWHLSANAYAIGSKLTLWNNFTHYLNDPVNGDQHAQDDDRTILGGSATYSRYAMIDGTIESDTDIGTDVRYDDISVNLIHTRQRRDLAVINADKVQESSAGVFISNTTYWTSWVRTVVGARWDYFNGNDRGTFGGNVHQSLFQPKGSIVFSPGFGTEFYISAGRGFHSNDVRGAIAGSASLLAKSKGAEVGIRSSFFEGLDTTISLFEIDFDSEITYDADAGADVAGRPSRRVGIEWNVTYQPFPWLEIYGSIAGTRARYTDHNPAGSYIPDAPSMIGSLAIYVRDLGRWSGSLELRDLGSHPLIENNSIRDKGYREWNMSIGYSFDSGYKLDLSGYNILDSKDSAADYYYVDRLPGETAGGMVDTHIHPLEPASVRLTLTKTFD